MTNPQNLAGQLKSLQDLDGAQHRTVTLSIDCKDRRGKHYVADFVYSVPNVNDQIQIGRIKTQLLPQGSAADPNAESLVEMISYLQITIDQKALPDWWKPFELFDSAPIVALYREALTYERRFLGGDTQQEPVAGDSAGGVDGPQGAGDAPVEPSVPSAPQRPETLVSHRAGTR